MFFISTVYFKGEHITCPPGVSDVVFAIRYLVTVTKQDVTFPSSRIIIVVEPAFIAVIKPSAVTVAIEADLVVYVTAEFVASGGDIIGASW